ncbi:MAG: type II toxin-antitoxin system RelE/ParE family toxin [Candidatus Sulfopaludibacter sp.]|nr:type II toxin-antitoxin system RelE/ParE family toxin [Candidatus Sulfopaludibacter sp.]
MEIRWSLPAAEDLERICERIERDNPDAARRVARTIYDACAEPENSAAECLDGGNCCFLPSPYVVVYKVSEQAVEISRIFHSTQDWP